MKRFIVCSLCLLGLALLAGSCGKSDSLLGAGDRDDYAVQPAEATAPAGIPTQVVTLIAGRSTDIGTVQLWLDEGCLAVQYETRSSWVVTATHLAVAASLEGIPVNPAGNPQVGHFPYAQSHSLGVAQYTYFVDLTAAGLENEPVLHLAAQADAARMSGGQVVGREGAWAQGEPFERLLQAGPGGKGQGGNWAMHFTVDMNKLRGLLLWNKLGSEWEVLHSMVGPNGVITGAVTYLPGQYGNGFKPLPRTGDPNIPDNFIDFAGLNLGPKGCIEFWYLPDWSDWRVGHTVEFVGYGIPGPTATLVDFYAQYNDWQDLLGVGFTNGQGDWANSAGVSLVPASTPGWSTTQPFHMAITWDGSAPLMADRLKTFINAVQVGTGSAGGNPEFSNWSSSSVLRLASRISSGDWYRHHWEGDHAIIDNIKIWNYPKADFSDRFQE